MSVTPISDSEPSVCIVVPLSTRDHLTSSEEISLLHLERFLGRFDKCFIHPPELDVGFIRRQGFRFRPFATHFFGSAAAHNRLLLSKTFYEGFSDYEFVLIYHLDSLVFSDQLSHWCASGFDYLGPPWIQGPDTPWVKTERAGNGGFSLRRIPSLLRVLNTSGYPTPSSPDRRQPMADLLSATKGLGKSLLGRPPHPMPQPLTVDEEIQRYVSKGWNEDGFWAQHAVAYDPEFRVAPVDVALTFAFEGNPRICYVRSGQVLPFGCHAWEKYDRSFWDPWIIPNA